MTQPSSLSRLLDIMAALRTPATGCPWDLEQTFATIAPYTIEEAYEVADAIERGDLADLKDELGDLLLQVVYHSRMAEEQGVFKFDDVADAVSAKMIRRHPHVFGTETERAAGAEPGFWERLKAVERTEKAAAHVAPQKGSDPAGLTPGSKLPVDPAAISRGVRPAGSDAERHRTSLLDDTPVGLPALTRAIKLQNKAAKVGFDWPSLAPVFEKMREELAELEAEILGAHSNSSPAPSRRLPEQESEGASKVTEGASLPSLAPSGRLPERESEGAINKPEGARRETAIKEEFGDLLFVMANVARHLHIDPEAALRSANAKFIRRFQHVEQRLAQQGKSPEQSSLAEMDALWDEAKERERK